LLCTVTTHDEVLLYMGRFMQYYREHGKYLERTYSFVERTGIDTLRQILVQDSLGICAHLHAHQFNMETGTGSEPDEGVQVYTVQEVDDDILLRLEGTRP
jgi:NAD(P)H-nitrite reductase large subunit